MHDTLPLLRDIAFPPLRRANVRTLQLNLGYSCNLSCIHCHVNAGPRRTETMSRETLQAALDAATVLGIETLDLTGGSPEMNVDFRWLVETATARGLRVMDRLNLTIMEEPGYDWVGGFLAAHGVEVVASLPCYSQANVDEQRGDGVFESSIRGLQALNALGYAQPDRELVLNLVYNPNGAFLPPPQGALEDDYRRLLRTNFDVDFNRLYTIANMPIQRFGSWLVSKGQFHAYMGTLRAAHRDGNLEGVMCRSTLSVGYDGALYDCDFNQMLGLPITHAGRTMHVTDLLHARLPDGIRVAGHCYGCTAGQGSSCGGALAPSESDTELSHAGMA
ncbi:arsenosugar biosynthesis radical SAM (seleno)protein ArsS [Lysobacter xanthus]